MFSRFKIDGNNLSIVFSHDGKALLDFVGKFGDGDDLSLKSHQAIKAEKYE